MTLFALFLALGTVTTPSRDPKGTLAFSISADRHEYVQHGLVRLTTTMKNTNNRTVDDAFALDPRHFPQFAFWYRRVGVPFVKYDFRDVEDVMAMTGPGPFVSDPSVGEPFGPLGPGQAHSPVFSLCFDSLAKRFVLDSPGEYEFQVRYEHRGTDRRLTLFESNVVRVKVTAPDTEEQEAFAAYTSDLARLAQGVFPGADRLIEPAVEFYERYPDSTFAEPVAEGLMPMLGDMVRENRAPTRYHELYEALRVNNAERVKRDSGGGTPP
jgi:hypothetical protein